jgi:hypothetical protein
MPYIAIGIILLAGLSLYLVSCRNKSSTNVVGSTNIDSTKGYHTTENTFEGLRKMAFNVTPDQLGLALRSNQITVYGVIMDWGMEGATATTVAYQTGDASLYLSSGGGVIGGGQHDNVKKAARQLVGLAQDYLSKAKKTDTTPLPDKDKVIFYLLTNEGVYTLDRT